MPRNNGFTYSTPKAAQRRFDPPMMAPNSGDMVPYQSRRRDFLANNYSSSAQRGYGRFPTTSGPEMGRASRGRRGKGWGNVGGTASRGFRTVGKGYSKFQALYGSIAFGTSLLIGIMKFNNVKGTIEEVNDECNHAAVILRQLDAVLSDRDAQHHLKSDRAGRKLLEKLRHIRGHISQTIDDLQDRVGKYPRNHLGFLAKVQFFIDDSHKVSGLRGRLRHNLDILQDLTIWLHR
jgi:hypothetical protein